MAKKILVADDDPAIVEVLQLILEEEYDVETAVDGETIRTVKEDLPDLILLDIWMSGMDGRDICRYLKSQVSTQHIPIIMISANKDTEKLARECGADDFLSKPFEMDDLLEKVSHLI